MNNYAVGLIVGFIHGLVVAYGAMVLSAKRRGRGPDDRG